MDLYIKVREGALEISVFSLRDFFFFLIWKIEPERGKQIVQSCPGR